MVNTQSQCTLYHREPREVLSRPRMRLPHRSRCDMVSCSHGRVGELSSETKATHQADRLTGHSNCRQLTSRITSTNLHTDLLPDGSCRPIFSPTWNGQKMVIHSSWSHAPLSFLSADLQSLKYLT